MIHPQDVPALQDKMYDTENLARLMVDHITNEKGEILARVWENPGFQEIYNSFKQFTKFIYDYKGIEKTRRRLKRKAEQVYNRTNAATQLFQKVYYHPELLADDEVTLRQSFVANNFAHERNRNLIRGVFFIGYWPLTYFLSRKVRAPTVGLFTLGYLGVHALAQRAAVNQMQSSLNFSAEGLAKKYGIKTNDEYVSTKK